MITKPFPRLAILMMLVCVTFTGCGAKPSLDVRGVKANGRVVRKMKILKYIVSFNTRDGREHEHIHDGSLEVGQQVVVLYDPLDPGIALVE